MIRRILYWLAVVAISAFLTYLLIRLAEGLDASQVGSRAPGGRDAALMLGRRATADQREPRATASIAQTGRAISPLPGGPARPVSEPARPM